MIESGGEEIFLRRVIRVPRAIRLGQKQDSRQTPRHGRSRHSALTPRSAGPFVPWKMTSVRTVRKATSPPQPCDLPIYRESIPRLLSHQEAKQHQTNEELPITHSEGGSANARLTLINTISPDRLSCSSNSRLGLTVSTDRELYSIRSAYFQVYFLR